MKENDVPVVEIVVSRLCPSGEALSLWDELHLTLNDYKYLFQVMQTIRSDFAIPANMGDAFRFVLFPTSTGILLLAVGSLRVTGSSHQQAR